MKLRDTIGLVCLVCLVCLAGAIWPAPASAAAHTLAGGPERARVYSAILDADFDRASHLLEDACPPAPNEACLVLDATRIMWRIQLDPAQTRWDDAFTKAATEAIGAT